jgi:hypothetical protein
MTSIPLATPPLMLLRSLWLPMNELVDPCSKLGLFYTVSGGIMAGMVIQAGISALATHAICRLGKRVLLWGRNDTIKADDIQLFASHVSAAMRFSNRSLLPAEEIQICYLAQCLALSVATRRSNQSIACLRMLCRYAYRNSASNYALNYLFDALMYYSGVEYLMESAGADVPFAQAPRNADIRQVFVEMEEKLAKYGISEHALKSLPWFLQPALLAFLQSTDNLTCPISLEDLLVENKKEEEEEEEKEDENAIQDETIGDRNCDKPCMRLKRGVLMIAVHGPTCESILEQWSKYPERDPFTLYPQISMGLLYRSDVFVHSLQEMIEEMQHQWHIFLFDAPALTSWFETKDAYTNPVTRSNVFVHELFALTTLAVENNPETGS